MSTLINGVVLVGVAKIVTDFVVFYLLPDGVSEVMRNKRAEKVNKIQAFARMSPAIWIRTTVNRNRKLVWLPTDNPCLHARSQQKLA